MEVVLTLDRALQEELDASGIDLTSELVREMPGLQRESRASTSAGERSAAEVITASVALVTAMTPVLTMLIKRLLPHRTTKISMRESGKGREIIIDSKET